MPVFSAYVDAPDFLANGLPNSETGSLIGLNTTLAVGASLGATSLQVAGTTNAPGSGTFQAWILDGANSESVSASVSDSTHLAVPAGTLAAHSAGVSVSSAGQSGCLASLIANASALIETLCRQGPDAGSDRALWQQSRTEKLGGPSLRVAFDVDGNLVVRPYHWPVISATSAQVQMGPQTSATIDLTFQYFPNDARTIVIPWAKTVTVQPGVTSWLIAPYPRSYGFVTTLTYVGGPCAGTSLASVPQPIKEACYLLVMDRLGFRINAIGAASIRRGDEQYETRLRGDTSGMSLLRMQAQEYLKPYMTRW